MKTVLARRHGGRIASLDVDILAEESYTTTRSNGGTYASAALVLLLLSDGQEWIGCARCTVVDPDPARIIAHQKAHQLPATARRRQARRITTRTTTSSEVIEEGADETVVGVEVPETAGTLPSATSTRERRARLAARAVPEAPPSAEVTDAPRAVTEIAADLERAEAWGRALRAEMAAALDARSY